MIKSIFEDQGELIKSILHLHVDGAQITLDPTYSTGGFYNKSGIAQPLIKADLFPRFEDVMESDACDLPLGDGSQKCVMFDPPFVVGQTRKDGPKGIIRGRFDGFPYIKDLWEWYGKCLAEFHRIMEKEGVLIFKCQDTVSSSKQYLSHVWIINKAEKEGFYCKDMFVLLAKSRIKGHNHGNQKHCRKFHSYFLVFAKKDVNVSHDPDQHGTKASYQRR